MNSEEKFIKYGKTLSGLIHNLNTPLMGISGRVELMQMKLGDDKNVVQISTQLDRLNSMLTAVAYLLDKEISNKETKFDLKILLENYFTYLTTDMVFKHKVEKEINLESIEVTTNPANLINFIHKVFEQLLSYVEEEVKMTIRNTKTEQGTNLEIMMSCQNDITKDLNIVESLKKRMFEEVKNKYDFQARIVGNQAGVKIIIS